MELLMTPEYYVIVDGEHTLWCSRSDSSIKPLPISELHRLTDPTCLGIVHGIVGKFQPFPESDPRLVVIKQSCLVGCLSGGKEVFKIVKVAVIPLSSSSEATDLDLEPCKKHSTSQQRILSSGNSNNSNNNNGDHQTRAFQKTWNTIKTATAQVKPVRKLKVRRLLRKSHKPKEIRERDKYERRLVDELGRMFNDTDSFYYSTSADLTNSLQRQAAQSAETKALPIWKRVDDRFFWNADMLRDLIDAKESTTDVDHWIVPVIQGFIQMERCFLDGQQSTDTTPADVVTTLSQNDTTGMWTEVSAALQAPQYGMTLISRRSKYRAGTRYKRRGVDDFGHCANYVETEQLFEYTPHVVSFVQTRGSVPVYWSQPGYKYRPPPRLDRGEEETNEAFARHFEEQIRIYGLQVLISLVEQTGREKIIADSYYRHVINYDSPQVIYVTFDFHEYCRGMRFENVSVLIECIKDILRDMRYCWVDAQGVICEQLGVFRVNCIDCLDRTNVVQTAIARAAMETQFVRLGLMGPEGTLPLACRRIFQTLWANNGDTISRQYAGTAALKGDYTRTGSRKFSGMMRDGYNSASRYYVNRFRDAYRQAAIDIMLGVPVNQEDWLAVSPESEVESGPSLVDSDQADHHEHVKQLIEDAKRMLIPDAEIVLGGWALIDADPVYDDMTDRITKYQKVLLEDLEKIELGPEPSLFKAKHYCIRIHYVVGGQTGYFHMFRSANTRFFNNVAIPIASEEESIESLKAICEAFKVTLSVKSLNVPLFEGKLERRKSKMPFFHGDLTRGGLRPAGSHPFPNLELPHMPRNISEGQLMNFVNVGSKALSNVTSQFAKLNPIRGMRSLGGGRRSNAGGSSSGNTCNVAPPMFGGSSSALLVTVAEDAAANFDGGSDTEEQQDAAGSRMSQQQMQLSSASLGNVSQTSDGGNNASGGGGGGPTAVTAAAPVAARNSTAAGGLSIDRTLSSDYSECSDLEDITDPVLMEAPPENQDALLESCGILATSPSLKGDIRSTHTYSDDDDDDVEDDDDDTTADDGFLGSDSEESSNKRVRSSTTPGGGSAANLAIRRLSSSDRETNRHGSFGRNRRGVTLRSSSASRLVASADVDDFVIDAMKRASLRNLRRQHRASLNASKEALHRMGSAQTLTPTIQVTTGDAGNTQLPVAISGMGGSMMQEATSAASLAGARGRSKKLSKSSENLESSNKTPPQQPSKTSKMTLQPDSSSSGDNAAAAAATSGGMKMSHSESAIRDFDNAGSTAEHTAAPGSLSLATSPQVARRDLVLSPLTRLARGVQNIGSAVGRRIGTTPVGGAVGGVASFGQYHITEHEMDQLRERKKHCKSRIMEL